MKRFVMVLWFLAASFGLFTSTGRSFAQCLPTNYSVTCNNIAHVAINGTEDNSQDAHTRVNVTGPLASRPSTCGVGEEFFASDAAAGQNKYLCTAANTWTQQVGGAPTTAQVQAAINGQPITPSTVAAGTSVQIAGDTAITSQSSHNSQVVTCPPTGTLAQYCGADGAWHTVSGLSGLTINNIPKAASASALGASAISDDGTNVTSSEPVRFGAPSANALAACPGGHCIAADVSSTTASPEPAVNTFDSRSAGWYVSEAGGAFSRLCTAANGQCAAVLPNLANSVLGDTASALIVDGTSIPRGNSLGYITGTTAGAWGTANTAASAETGTPQGSGYGYNPKTTTPLMGLQTYAYDLSQLPALKGKLTWIQNFAYDGTDSSHVLSDLTSASGSPSNSINGLCAQAGTTYNHVYFIADTGTNDFGGSLGSTCEASSAATVLSTMKSIWSSATNAGCTVIAVTPMTRQYATGYQSSYYSGYVTVSSGTVTWVSGTQFTGASSSVNQICGTSGGTPLVGGDGHVIIINGVQYPIATVTSATSLTLGGSGASITLSGNQPYLAGQEIERQVYNTSVRSLLGQGYFWGLLDADVILPNGILMNDGIHPSPAGHAVIAAEGNKVLLTGGSPGYPAAGVVPMNFLDTTSTLAGADNNHVPTDAAMIGYNATHGMNLLAHLTTTAATSDNVTVTGMTSSGHCLLTPTTSSAATNIATSYVSAKTTNQITVTHTATASMGYDIACSAN